MNGTQKRRRTGLIPDPGRIAPSVDKGWRDDFIVELRLLGVPGDRIGDALMTVETHVAESREGAQDAFGEAHAYAREVAESSGAAGSRRTLGAQTVGGVVLGLLGMYATVRAFTGWLEGAAVGVMVGDLVVLGVLLALALVALAAATAVLRLVTERPWAVAFLPAILIGGFVGLMLQFQEPLVDVPALPVGLAGLVLLAASSILFWMDQPADLDAVTAPGMTARPSLAARVLTVLPMPIMTVLLLGFVWVLHLITG